VGTIRDAIVVAGPGDEQCQIARVPLLLRTILTLQRQGIERITLVGAAPPRDGRIRCQVTSAAQIVPPASDALHVVIGAGSVVDGPLIGHLQDIAVPGRTIDLARDGARVRVAPGRAVSAPVGVTTAPTRGTLAATVTPSSAIETTLLYGLENHRDGYLDRILHRHLSRPLTRQILRTPLTPNAVTVLGIAIGILGGLSLSVPGALGATLAVALLTLSSVLDCCDGEVARIRFSESRLGHLLDITGDTLVHLGLFAGIARRLAASGATPSTEVLTVLGLGVLGAFLVITWSEATETRRMTDPGIENRILANVLSPLTTRDWYVFPLAFALAGRLDALVPAAAVGAHVFWIVTLVVLRRVLRRV
jgi:phosphatidylglycerophosphate synthase